MVDHWVAEQGHRLVELLDPMKAVLKVDWRVGLSAELMAKSRVVLKVH